MEEKIVDHTYTTKNLISGLTERVEKISMSKIDKPVPTSFLYKRNINIQDAIKPINRFPTLFSKEVATTSEEKPEATEKVTIASLFREEEDDKKESESQIFPIYEPLESRFNNYPSTVGYINSLRDIY